MSTHLSDSLWERHTKRFWHSPWFASLLIGIFAALGAYWLFHIPPPGYAVAALAVAAALMTFRSEPSGLEKVLWMFVLFGLLFIELRAIDNDRRESHQEQQAARIQQDKEFESVLQQTQEQFEATVNQMKSLSDLSKENIDAVTGGRGFVLIDVSRIPVDGTGLSLIAVISGKNVIRQISYTITEGRPPYRFTPDDINKILTGGLPAHTQGGQIGDLSPRFAKPFLVLHPSQKDGAYYNINIVALNGSTNEKLEVRFNPAGQRWDRKLTVTRDNRVVLNQGWDQGMSGTIK